jgi:DNA repair photolyase
MPLKKSVGNMYPWVTHTHSHLGGECPHHCAYCYVNNPRFGRPARYTGELRLIAKEFGVKYGEGKSIFVENCNDLFADAVPRGFISDVLTHCRAFPKNEYIFQSKNPGRMWDFLSAMPENVLLGTTIESNRWHTVMGNAPAPLTRVQGVHRLHQNGKRVFVTIEPILDLDVDVMVSWLYGEVVFVNIGADSKGHGLPEPDGAKVLELVSKLQANGIEIRKKHNLGRLTD